MKIKLSYIINAIDFTDQYSEYFLDRVTGEVVLVNDMMMTSEEKEEICDRLDEHGFYRLPDSSDIDDYSTMESFISTLAGPAADRLSNAISGRGAFRRFKDTIRSMGLENSWYEYQESAHKNAAIRWCEENDLEWEE
ncbi:MAG: hypothetical protein IK099_06000 [Clostridia bacterium]|nr:hypothetical protein [Clostridia bacterium]